MPEEHVLDDVQVVTEREVLVHGRDSEIVGFAWRADVDFFALPKHLTATRRVDPRDCLDQRRLASAVVANECGDFSRGNIKVTVAKCLDRTKVLRERPQTQQRRLVQNRSPRVTFRLKPNIGREGNR